MTNPLVVEALADWAPGHGELDGSGSPQRDETDASDVPLHS
jgi:hypothetical protein